MKKFRKSPIAIACYVFAAVFAAYCVAIEVGTISTIYEYYAPYQMTPSFGEVIGYMLQQGMQPLMAAILTLMAGIILEEVRKLNPANWATDEEIAEAKEAKAMAREAKQIAKGEAAKAAAEAASGNESDSETIKPEFAVTVAEEYDEVVAEAEEEEAAVTADPEPEAEEAGSEEKEFSDVFAVEIDEDNEDDKTVVEKK